MKLIFTLLLLIPISIQADEFLPIKGDGITGLLVLEKKPCEIDKVSAYYSFKARIETNYGNRRGCWEPTYFGNQLLSNDVIEEEIADDDTRLYHLFEIPASYFQKKTAI